MKKIVLGILIMVSFYSNAQEYKLEEKSVTGIFEANGKTKAELFSAINKWISVNYNSANSVIQLNDLESGTIIVKGINTIVNKSFIKSFLHPDLQKKTSFNTMTYNFSHLIEINIKDNKFRIMYLITKYEDYGNDNEIFKRINFEGIDNNTVENYNALADGLLETFMIDKKNKQAMRDAMKPMLDEMNSSLENDIKNTLQSIYKTATEKTEGW
jgi:hypothetical protein